MEKRKRIAVVISVVLVLAQAVFIPWSVLTGSNLLIYNLFLINILCGPLCIIFYLIEVKKGVFKDDDDEETA